MNNYDRIKSVQRNERKYERLTKIPDDFYEQSIKYICSIEKEDVDVREYMSILSSYSEIVERRLNKITERTIFLIFRKNRLGSKVANMDDEDLPVNIIPSEVELYQNLFKAYNKFYEERNEDYRSNRGEGE